MYSQKFGLSNFKSGAKYFRFSQESVLEHVHFRQVLLYFRLGICPSSEVLSSSMVFILIFSESFCNGNCYTQFLNMLQNSPTFIQVVILIFYTIFLFQTFCKQKMLFLLHTLVKERSFGTFFSGQLNKEMFGRWSVYIFEYMFPETILQINLFFLRNKYIMFIIDVERSVYLVGIKRNEVVR